MINFDKQLYGYCTVKETRVYCFLKCKNMMTQIIQRVNLINTFGKVLSEDSKKKYLISILY